MNEERKPRESKFWGHEGAWAGSLLITGLFSAMPIGFHDEVHILVYVAFTVVGAVGFMRYADRYTARNMAEKPLPKEEGRCRISGIFRTGERTLVSPTSKTPCGVWCLEYHSRSTDSPRTEKWRATIFGLELRGTREVVWFLSDDLASPFTGVPDGGKWRDVKDQWDLEHTQDEVYAAICEERGRPPTRESALLPSDSYPPTREWTFCDGDAVTLDADVSPDPGADLPGRAYQYHHAKLSHGDLGAVRAHWESERWKRWLFAVPIGSMVGLLLWMVALAFA